MKKKKHTYAEAAKIVARTAQQLKQKRGKYYERWKAGMEEYRKRK